MQTVKLLMTTNIEIKEKPMHARQEMMDDGRYIIYYTFGESAEGKAGEVNAAPEEEKNV